MSDSDLRSFQAHMDRCMRAVLAPMGRPDICVTIVVRAPEALPSEAMISTNDALSNVRDALEYAAPNATPMDAEREKLNLYRQWFNAVQDLNPAHLERSDYLLARELYERLSARVPHSILREIESVTEADPTKRAGE